MKSLLSRRRADFENDPSVLFEHEPVIPRALIAIRTALVFTLPLAITTYFSTTPRSSSDIEDAQAAHRQKGIYSRHHKSPVPPLMKDASMSAAPPDPDTSTLDGSTPTAWDTGSTSTQSDLSRVLQLIGF
jgi:hypothetical protein